MPLILTRIVVAACALSAAAAPSAEGQTETAVVRIRAIDSSGVAVAGADVIVARGMSATVAAGVTDDAGLVRLTIPKRSDDLEVVARRIGFLRASHFFRADRDTISITLRLQRVAQELPSVAVTAARSAEAERNHVTADDIMTTKRVVASGLDVITKMRPEMMKPRGTEDLPNCGLFNLWINGSLVVNAPIDQGLAAQTRQQREAKRTLIGTFTKRDAKYEGQMTVPVLIQSVLSRIHAEHIDEMNYVNCRDDKTASVARSRNGLFILLKPGVAYDPGRGSYVATLPIATNAELPRYRRRLLGVFDEVTGEPVSGVAVLDSASGNFVRTSATGAASLGFIAEGPGVLRLHRDGYADLVIELTISPRDTTPITVLLKPVGK